MLIAACTVVSRITGLLRDMLLVHAFGLTWALDAFNYAFQIPNLFRRLFGEGALAAVFVPTFTRTLETEGRPSAWKVLARVLALMTIILAGIIILIELVILYIWFAHPGGEARRLVLTLTGLMLPFMLTICAVALFSSILNCLGSFVPAALAPVVLNLGMIAGILWLAPAVAGDDPTRQILAVALSVLVAGVVQIALLLPVLRLHDVALGWKLDLKNPHVREIAGRMVPILFGQGVLILGTFLDSQVCTLLTSVNDGPEHGTFLGISFAYPLREGALSTLTVAQRLYQFPLGVLGISIAVAALPVFSRLAVRRDWPAWKTEVSRAARLALFDGLLTGGAMVVLAGPIVQFLFEYRKFDAQDTARAAHVLVFYGFGMWAFCVQHIVLRAFYSLGDVRTPVKISCVMVPLNLALSLILLWVDSIAVAAFAISSTVTAAITVLIGFLLLQRRARVPLLDRELALAAAKMLLACALASAAAYGVHELCSSYITNAISIKILQRAINTGCALATATGLFLGIGALLGLPETKMVLKWRRRGGRSA